MTITYEQFYLSIFIFFKGTIEPVVDEKELRCDEIRESCNRPPIIVGAHYARDNEGLPIHYNGNYVSN